MRLTRFRATNVSFRARNGPNSLVRRCPQMTQLRHEGEPALGLWFGQGWRELRNRVALALTASRLASMTGPLTGEPYATAQDRFD
jgi:hypothetical protein